MKNILLFGALTASLTMSSVALAQETPSQTWNDSATWRSPNEKSVDLAIAEAIERKRNNGYGPGDTYVAGNVNSYTTNQGPVTSNTATNAINYTANDSRVDISGSGSQSTITYSTGATSYDATQSASSQSAATGTGDNTLSNGPR